jgi:hypothetical protein
MSGTPISPRPDLWIVQGDEVSSGRLAKRIETDSGIERVRQIAPDVVVLSMSPERARRLKAEFGKRLVIERDADLHQGAARIAV